MWALVGDNLEKVGIRRDRGNNQGEPSRPEETFKEAYPGNASEQKEEVP